MNGYELRAERIKFQKVLGEKADLAFNIWYHKNPNFTAPSAVDIKDYTYLMSLCAEEHEQVFFYLQGERYSPFGEARDLISALGLHHTSMSVGDLLHERTRDIWYIVATSGFNEVFVKGV